MRIIAIAVAAAAFSFGPAAMAQERAGAGPSTSVPVTEAPRRDLSASLHVSTGLLATEDDEQQITRTHLSFALQLNYRDRLFITPFIRTNSTTVSLTRPDGQPFNATLVLPWQVSFGGNVTWRFLKLDWFDLAAFVEFDFPASSNTARTTGIELLDDVSDIAIDAATVRERVSIRHDWRRFDFGLTARATLGIWHPFLDIAYVHMPGTLTVSFDESARELLTQAGVSPAPSYDAGFSSFFYSLGSDFDLGDSGFVVRIRGTAAPISGGWVFTGEAGLIMPIGTGWW